MRSIRPLMRALSVLAAGFAPALASGVPMALTPGHADTPAAELTPRTDPGWDAVFTRTDFWNAGDIGHSIDLGDARTLWLFGDSIYGPVRDGKRIGGESKMFRAGIAWHATPGGGGVPALDAVRFAAPEPFGDGPVAAWTMPAPGLFPAGSWYWLMNDGVRVATAAGSRVVLFATAIGPSGNPDGMWNFRRVGGAVLTIENPDDPPDAWRATHAVNPLVNATGKHGEQERAGENWAVAIVRETNEDPSGTPGASRDAYFVFGVRNQPGRPHSLLVARADAETLATPLAWEFFIGTGWSAATGPATGARVGGVAEASSPAAELCSGVPDEFTVQRVLRGEEYEYVLVQSEPMLGRRILVRTARRPEGPWSEPKAVYEVADLGPKGMTYAAKGHAHLSRPGELLVSYVINAEFGRVFAEAGLYRPRFVRVPVQLLPEAPVERSREP